MIDSEPSEYDDPILIQMQSSRNGSGRSIALMAKNHREIYAYRPERYRKFEGNQNQY